MSIIKTVVINLDKIINNFSNIFDDIEEINALNSDHCLKIPIYQRPYLWSEKSVKRLFDDIYDSYQKNEDEYRLGTIILHQEKEDNKKNGNNKDNNDNNDNKDDKDDNKCEKYVYNVVDGQQRLITLSLLIYILNDQYKFLFSDEINSISKKSVIDNYNILKDKVKIVNDKEVFLNYILNKCTLGIIVTNEQEEAFQFFDSQNTRGKKLAPHDLLKAYHLREIDNKDIKIKIVKEWENIEENCLKELFSDYLFPIKLWSKGEKERNFTENEVEFYEGISLNKEYNYLKYRKKENLENYSFQINEIIFSGEYFFKYVFHYKMLHEIVRKQLENKNITVLSNEHYINTMFCCALMLFVDRFNEDILNDKEIIKKIYKWSYGLRLSRDRVTRKVRNKYVTGGYDDGLGSGALFKIINEMGKPDEILELEIKIYDRGNTKFNTIRNLEIFKI